MAKKKWYLTVVRMPEGDYIYHVEWESAPGFHSDATVVISMSGYTLQKLEEQAAEQAKALKITVPQLNE